MSKNKTQAKIKSITLQYINIFSDEVALFNKAMQSKRQEGTGEIQGDHVVSRAILEVPETLNNMFIMKLTEEDREFFDTKEGVRWFAREFPIFSLVKKV